MSTYRLASGDSEITWVGVMIMSHPNGVNYSVVSNSVRSDLEI